jgi:O-antigen ligase
MDKEKKRGKRNRLANSLFISGLTRFSTWIYASILSGVFGLIFTSYRRISKGFRSSFLLTKLRELFRNMKENPFKRAKHSIAKVYEQSLVLSAIQKLSHGLLVTHINNVGLICFSYGFCVVTIQLLKLYTFHVTMENPYKSLIVGIVVMCSGIFMFFSRKSIAALLYESRAARFILFDVLGFRTYGISQAAKQEPRRSFNISLVFGLLLGGLTIFVDAIRIPAVFVFLLIFAIVMNSPESVIILVFLTLPFLTTMQLVFTMCLIYLSYLLKFVCGRRVFRMKLTDFSALIFMTFVFFGGIYSVDSSSFEKMCVFVCFMAAYFVVKNTLGSPVLVRRCIYALITSSVVVSLIGLYQNFFGTFTANAWLDKEMFSEIDGRVVSTFQNPNVLGEYIILIFPLILAMMASAKRKNEKFAFFFAAVVNCACLVFTWSRGAWLGFLLSLIVFFAVSNKHFLTAGILSIPVFGIVLYFAMDTAIVNRFTNITDSSSSYRFNIWRGVIRMLDSIGLHGIGIGEGAFRMIYPGYALSGIEAAPHSHNLFLQILVETGIFSLIAFLVFLFFYTPCSLCFCKEAYNRANKLICLGFFSGTLAFLVQGLTDYVWYNYRIFLLFWMVIGLGLAHIRTARGTEEESVPYA